MDPPTPPPGSTWGRDLWFVGVFTAVAVAIAVSLDLLSPSPPEATEPTGSAIAPGLFFATVALAVGLAIYAFRRWLELRRERAWREQALQYMQRLGDMEDALRRAHETEAEARNLLSLASSYARTVSADAALPAHLKEPALLTARGLELAQQAGLRAERGSDLPTSSSSPALTATARSPRRIRVSRRTDAA